MNRKARIDYMLAILCMFVSSFIIYSIVSSLTADSAFAFTSHSLLGGLAGGYGFTAILHTIIVGARFFAKKGRCFRMIAALLWPITIYAFVVVGFFSFIPYFIYNLVKIFQGEKRPQ